MAEETKGSFVDSLDAKQLENFNLVFDTAKAMGLNPRLAVAIAFKETGLRQLEGDKVIRGKDGEIGMMQVKPTTAEQLGYKPQDLNDAQTNVRIGLEYLKNNLDRFQDPRLAVMAYNAGPDNAFLTGKSDEPPSMDYINKIGEYGGFQPYRAPEEAKTETQPVEVSDQDYDRSLKMGLIGGGAGASLGAGQVAKSVAGEILNRMRGQTPGGTTPGGKWGAKTGYGIGEGTVQDVSSRYQRAVPKGEISGRMAKTFGPRMPGESADLVERLIQRGQAAEQAASPLAKAGAFFRNPIVQKGLAGAGAGFSTQEALQRYSQGDYPGAAIAATGALGSLASMVPFAPVKAIGAATAVASPAALMVLDKMRRANPQQVQRALTNVDAMGNPLP